MIPKCESQRYGVILGECDPPSPPPREDCEGLLLQLPLTLTTRVHVHAHIHIHVHMHVHFGHASRSLYTNMCNPHFRPCRPARLLRWPGSPRIRADSLLRVAFQSAVSAKFGPTPAGADGGLSPSVCPVALGSRGVWPFQKGWPVVHKPGRALA